MAKPFFQWLLDFNHYILTAPEPLFHVTVTFPLVAIIPSQNQMKLDIELAGPAKIDYVILIGIIISFIINRHLLLLPWVKYVLKKKHIKTIHKISVV